MISDKKPLFTEPKVLITGVEGAGKTLLAVQQADLLARETEGAEIYQLNIKGADPIALPKLPFAIDTMAYNEDGSPRLDENGSHLPMWATLPAGSVIIVDECHKVFPQRGPGRSPAHVEMMAEGRQNGIRFVLLTQAPASMDAFLRDRIHRHYHLERKGNMQGATVFEFDHCVDYPRKAFREKEEATKHLWRYPKQYYGWYKSADSHHFKLRIPWKIWAALLFIPIAGYTAWRVVHTVGGMTQGLVPSAEAKGRGQHANTSADGEPAPVVATDAAGYLKQFRPMVASMPYSAPAYQGRPVASQPELYCMHSAPGLDAQGAHQPEGCHCVTEQGTRVAIDLETCHSVAVNGVYNPFRDPTKVSNSEAAKLGEARQAPSSVPPAIPSAPLAVGAVEQPVAAYGAFRGQ